MDLEKIAEKVLETDVLVLGGGLAGSMAAIQATRQGARVVLMEKSAVRRSGDAGGGQDHMPNIAHPKFNDLSPEEFAANRHIGLEGLVDPALTLQLAKYAFAVVKECERLGVKLKEEDGYYRMQEGRIKGKKDFMLYRGADLKIKLEAAVRGSGTTMLERTMFTSLLTHDGRVVGATGVGTRTGEFVVVKARSVILASGGVHRLYWHPHGGFPSNLFILYQDPQNCGDGTAVAYRAGAKLCNMEFVYAHTNAAGLPRAFTLTWYPVQNSKGERIMDKHSSYIAKMPSDPPYARTAAVFHERGELLTWDPTQMPDDKERFWDFMMSNERPYSIKMAQILGGVSHAPREARTWFSGVPRGISGVKVTGINGETSLPGLYAVGDVMGGHIMSGATGALVWGYLAGCDAARTYAACPEPIVDRDRVHAERERVLAPLGREQGLWPLELENTVRKVVTDYVGFEKLEAKLQKCIAMLDGIEAGYMPALAAHDPHELMRALELQDILTVGRVHAQAAMLRTESRLVPWHYRMDYPEQDDEHWRRSLILWQENGQMHHDVTPIWSEAA